MNLLCKACKSYFCFFSQQPKFTFFATYVQASGALCFQSVGLQAEAICFWGPSHKKWVLMLEK